MSDEIEPDPGYSCHKCGATGEFNDDCFFCKTMKHTKDKRKEYAKMGTVDAPRNMPNQKERARGVIGALLIGWDGHTDYGKKKEVEKALDILEE